MISKCHMSEIVSRMEMYIHHSEWDIRLSADQFWIGRLIELDDAILTLFLIGAISQNTFLDTRKPIVEFENKYGINIISRYNKPRFGM